MKEQQTTTDPAGASSGKAKHTRGKWFIDTESTKKLNDNGFIICGDEEGDGNTICRVFDEPSMLGCDDSGSWEAKQNALLIAAAPQLLEACEMALDRLTLRSSSEYEEAEYIDQLVSVIAAATGRK